MVSTRALALATCNPVNPVDPQDQFGALQPVDGGSNLASGVSPWSWIDLAFPNAATVHSDGSANPSHIQSPSGGVPGNGEVR
ncbi:hypothetical protein KI387_019820, partial [Taxus chinensis]